MHTHKHQKKQAGTAGAAHGTHAGAQGASGHAGRGNAFRQEQMAANDVGEGEDVHFDADLDEEAEGGGLELGEGHGRTHLNVANGASTVHHGDHEHGGHHAQSIHAKKRKKKEGSGGNTVLGSRGPLITKTNVVNASSTVRHSIKGDGGKKKGKH